MLAWVSLVILFAVWGFAICWPTTDERSVWQWDREQDAWRDTFR